MSQTNQYEVVFYKDAHEKVIPSSRLNFLLTGYSGTDVQHTEHAIKTAYSKLPDTTELESVLEKLGFTIDKLKKFEDVNNTMKLFISKK